MKLRIAGLIEESVVDGPGLRLAVFTQGCMHGCFGCHNPQTHAFDGGTEIDTAQIIEKLKCNPLLRGVTLSGGEPFEQAAACAVLARFVRQRGLHVLTYTGYTYESLLDKATIKEGLWELLCETDILIDGPFRIRERSLQLRFRGSRNQRVIDVQQSLKEGRTVLLDWDQGELRVCR